MNRKSVGFLSFQRLQICVFYLADIKHLIELVAKPLNKNSHFSDLQWTEESSFIQDRKCIFPTFTHLSCRSSPQNKLSCFEVFKCLVCGEIRLRWPGPDCWPPGRCAERPRRWGKPQVLWSLSTWWRQTRCSTSEWPRSGNQTATRPELLHRRLARQIILDRL